MRTLLALIFLLGIGVGCGCESETWSGVVYPDATNLTRHFSVGDFDSLEDCRAAAVDRIHRMGASRTGDYECGLNCVPVGYAGMSQCERTEN
jgi:hypothetical protein